MKIQKVLFMTAGLLLGSVSAGAAINGDSAYVPDEKHRKVFLNRMIKCEFRANWGKPEAVFLTASENGRVVAVAQLCSPAYTKPSDGKCVAGDGEKRIRAVPWAYRPKLVSESSHRCQAGRREGYRDPFFAGMPYPVCCRCRSGDFFPFYKRREQLQVL